MELPKVKARLVANRPTGIYIKCHLYQYLILPSYSARRQLGTVSEVHPRVGLIRVRVRVRVRVWVRVSG